MKYSGKTLFLEEQPDGRYTLYSWYHAPIATAELEELISIIRDWEPPKPLQRRWNPQLDLNLDYLLDDTIHFYLADLE